PARGFRRIRQAHLREAPLYLSGITAWLLAALLLAGCSGSEPVGPLPDPDPVASVEILGPSRVKVGEAYQMVAVVRHANGEVSDQPVAWSVNDSTVGWVSSRGAVIADTALPFSLIARAGDLADTVDIEGYDWVYDESLASRLLLLESDAKITVGGGSGYPRLMVGCIAGTSWVALIATPAVVERQEVRYRFDAGAPVDENWTIAGDGAGLLYSGTTNASHKLLAHNIAASSRFRIRFIADGGQQRDVTFRPSGLSGKLATALEGC